MASIFNYSNEDFNYKTQWIGSEFSIFDSILTTKWKTMQELGGFFRYKFKTDKWKFLPGKHQYLAQLNLNRSLLRRKPEEMQSMNQEFNPSQFNFTKIDKKEIMFEITNKERKNKGNYIAINDSPLEFGHCLFLPALDDCLPQKVTFNSLLDAVELFLLSKTPALRMGFNGLCAHASVNHLHYHMYYLDHKMLLETIDVKHLAGPCYVLQSYPSHGFVFQHTGGEDVDNFVRNVFKLVNFLQESEKPHNIFITRGSSFEEKSCSMLRNYVRAYVWARKSVYGAKDLSTFRPAICEMFGHLLLKNEDEYEMMTEEIASSTMTDLTEEPFQSVVDQVSQLFQERLS